MSPILTRMIGAGSAMALGSMNNASATHGATGVSNAMSYAPAMGSVIGVSAVVRTVDKAFKTKKNKGGMF